MRAVLIGCAALVVAGCAKSAVMPLSADTFQLTAGAAPICGAVGAQSVATKQAAIEVIKRGYDKFLILGGGYQNNVRVIGQTSVVANTYGSATATAYGNSAYATGSATTVYSGGGPIVGGAHNQSLVVKMFKSSDTGASSAVDAREALGPNWQSAVKDGTSTCL